MRLLAFLAALALLLPAAAASGQVPDEARLLTEHFAITYSTDPADPDAPDLTDADSDGTPDSIARAAVGLEAAWTKEIDELGYLAPPVDGLYEVNVAVGTGQAHVRPAPGGSGHSRPSYMTLTPYSLRLSRADIEIDRLAAHEFFHAVQYGYDYLAAHWFQEASAAWMETIHYERSMLEELTIPAFLTTPELGLTMTGNVREYGALLFVRFLTERYGGGSQEGRDMVREIWELIVDPSAVPGATNLPVLEAIDEVLQTRGTDLRAAWAEFMVWQRQLKLFEDGASYRSLVADSEWPTFERSDVALAGTCRMDAGGVPQFAASYSRLRVKDAGLVPGRLVAKGPPDAVGTYTLKGPEGRLSGSLTFDGEGAAVTDIEDPGFAVRSMVIGLGSTWTPAEQLAYSLWAPEEPPTVESAAPSGPTDFLYNISQQLSGTVYCNGEPAAFTDIVLRSTESFGGEIAERTLTTDDDGRWKTNVSPDASSSFAVVVADPLLPSFTSAAHLVSVHVFVSMFVEEPIVEAGDPLLVYGDVTPATEGASMLIEYRRPERKRWTAGPVVTTDAAGHYTAQLFLPADGLWDVRARQLDDLDAEREPGVSLSTLVEVR